MKNYLWIVTGVLLLMHANLWSQSPLPQLTTSELMEKKSIPLVSAAFMEDSLQSFYDTIHLRFLLTNDLGTDTTIYYLEGLNEWVQLTATPVDTQLLPIVQITGRDYYWKIPYEYVYYPTQSLRLQNGLTYKIDIRYRGVGYSKASKKLKLLSPAQKTAEQAKVRTYFYTNHIITYLFLGAILFGFLFFFFLFIKSKYTLFGVYASFLLLQAIYGSYQVDLDTKFGEYFIHSDNIDDWFSECVVFIAQAIYIQFMILWMNIRKTNLVVYKIFNGISVFFLLYAATFTVLYHINQHDLFLGVLERGIRLASIAIQLLVFYLLFFKIKTPVRAYIITGTGLLVFFGVIVVFMHNGGWFRGMYLDTIDNGSWYMIGLLCECICFSMGLGLRYFQIDQENVKLQGENIRVLEDKLQTEKDAREKEKTLALLNQELTNQQLTALRAQMNPHFIFNALNSIQKYIVKGSVDEANSYLSKFSKLQRMILSYCDENFITLDKEIDMLRLYLEIEQLRLTNEFVFEITVDEEIEPEEIPIPPMILQPFVENAIWHGLVPKAGNKKLAVHFGLTGQETLLCKVEDNGIGRKAAQKIKEERLLDKTASRSKGMSLVNDRLEILEKKYGKAFTVKIIDKISQLQQSDGTIVELYIPVTD